MNLKRLSYCFAFAVTSLLLPSVSFAQGVANPYLDLTKCMLALFAKDQNIAQQVQATGNDINAAISACNTRLKPPNQADAIASAYVSCMQSVDARTGSGAAWNALAPFQNSTDPKYAEAMRLWRMLNADQNAVGPDRTRQGQWVSRQSPLPDCPNGYEKKSTDFVKAVKALSLIK